MAKAQVEIRLTPDGELHARRVDGLPLTPEDYEEALRLVIPDLPLETFARWNLRLKVWSELLNDTVWFVSTEEGIKVLLEEGVQRGSIYTAGELLVLINMLNLTGDQVKKIHEAKQLFYGYLVQV